jgi:DNA-binding XRE family transcriptional regulator
MEREISINSILKEELKDPEFRRGFEIENIKLEIAAEVFETRERLGGWTQSKLAQEADVSKSTVTEIENGNNINIETLCQLAAAMGKKMTINIE